MKLFLILVAGCATGPSTGLSEPSPESLMLAGVPADAWRFTSEFGCYHSTENPGGMPIQEVVDAVGPARVLILDQNCTVGELGLHLPERFTLSGAGWAGAGTLFVDGSRGIWFDSGADNETHTTVENLQIQGAGTGTAFALVDRHQVLLRNLVVRGFDTGVMASNSYSVTIEHSNFNNNEVGLSLGSNANGWRIIDGICSQNTTCMDIHPGGDGNDTLVIGVRMESNGTAIRVGGLSTSILSSRFEGNGVDVERLPSSSGTALFGNVDSDGVMWSDLSELNVHRLTELPVVDHQLRLGIAEGGSSSAELGTYYVPGDNLLRTLVNANQTTDNGVLSNPGYSSGYAGWQLVMDGSIVPATSEFRLEYRAPGSLGPPTEVFRVGSDGTVFATAFSATSDRRRKDDIAPVGDALAKLSRLRGVSWRWKDGDQRAMGVLAQDVETTFPEAVRAGDDGALTVSYDGLTAPIVEAIKELAAQNAALQQDNADLRARLTALERGGSHRAGHGR